MRQLHGGRFAACAAVLAALLGMAMAVIPASPAQALDPIACTGEQTAHFGPPLGPIPQPTTIAIDEQYGPDGDGACVGATEGQGHGVAHPPLAACLAGVPLPGADVIQYTFMDGAAVHMEVTYVVTATVRVGAQTIVTSSGTVTAGDRQGAPVQREVILLSTEIDECLQSELGTITGIAEIIIG